MFRPVRMILWIISRTPGRLTEPAFARRRRAQEVPKAIRREPAPSKQRSGSNVLSSSAFLEFLEMWPIMTLPALFNKSRMKASNFSGFDDANHAASADYACFLRYRSNELGRDVGDRLLTVRIRPF